MHTDGILLWLTNTIHIWNVCTKNRPFCKHSWCQGHQSHFSLLALMSKAIYSKWRLSICSGIIQRHGMLVTLFLCTFKVPLIQKGICINFPVGRWKYSENIYNEAYEWVAFIAFQSAHCLAAHVSAYTHYQNAHSPSFSFLIKGQITNGFIDCWTLSFITKGSMSFLYLMTLFKRKSQMPRAETSWGFSHLKEIFK